MKAVLTDRVETQELLALAEVAIYQARPELQRLCQRGEAAGGLGVTQCQAALPGLSPTGARNLLRACASLDLLRPRASDPAEHEHPTETYLLTAAGSATAKDGLVGIPEQGLYRITVAQHPLFGTRLLHLLREEVNDSPAMPREPPGALPLGERQRSLLDAELTFSLRRNPDEAHAISGPTLTLRWEIDFTAQQSHYVLQGVLRRPGETKGQLDEQPIPPRREPVAIDFAALLQRWTGGAFDPSMNRLRIPCDEVEKLPQAAQDGFLMDRPLGQVEVPRRGRYANVVLHEVPLCPADTAAAQRWALLRFDRARRRSKGYLARAALQDLYREVTEGTPLVTAPPLPPTDWLIKDRANASDRWGYWQLAAAEDLA